MFTTNPARDCVIITREDGMHIAWKLVAQKLDQLDESPQGIEDFSRQGQCDLICGSSAERLLRFLGYPSPTDEALEDVSEQLNNKFSYKLGSSRQLEFVYEDEQQRIMSIDVATYTSRYFDYALKLRVVQDS